MSESYISQRVLSKIYPEYVIVRETEAGYDVIESLFAGAEGTVAEYTFIARNSQFVLCRELPWAVPRPLEERILAVHTGTEATAREVLKKYAEEHRAQRAQARLIE